MSSHSFKNILIGALLMLGISSITYAAAGFKLISAGGIEFASFFKDNGAKIGVEADSFHGRINDTWISSPVDGSNSLGGNTYFSSGSSQGVLTASGNIGIRTSSPAQSLDVNGDAVVTNIHTRGSGGWMSDTYSGGLYMQDNTWIRTYNNKGIWTEGGLIGTQQGVSVGYWGATTPNGGAIIAGNVGIGNSSPAYKLDVSGDARVSRLYTDNQTPLAANELASKAYVDAAVSAGGAGAGSIDTLVPDFYCASSCAINGPFLVYKDNAYDLSYYTSYYINGSTSYWTTTGYRSSKIINTNATDNTDNVGQQSPWVSNLSPFTITWRCPTGTCYMGAVRYVTSSTYDSWTGIWNYTYGTRVSKFDYSTVPYIRTNFDLGVEGKIIPTSDGGFYFLAGGRIKKYNSSGTLTSDIAGTINWSYFSYNANYAIQCSVSGVNLICYTRDLNANLAVVGTYTFANYNTTTGILAGITSDNRIIMSAGGTYNPTTYASLGSLDKLYSGQSISQIVDLGSGKIATLSNGNIIFYNGNSIIGKPTSMSVAFDRIGITAIDAYGGKVYAIGSTSNYNSADNTGNTKFWIATYPVP